MNLSFNQAYPPVPYSITNPAFAQSETRDKSTPFSMLEFIKTVSGLVDSVNISSFYNNYISLWNSVNGTKGQSSQEFFVNSYTEFIREITLNYSTQAERKFLTSIDYSDKYDLDIVLGFIGKKIKEIALIYSKKREDIKLEPSRKKLKGSYKGFAIALREKILEFFKKQENTEDQLKGVANNIQVYVDELYDVNSSYLNKQPTEVVYDAADRDFVNLDIFLTSNDDVFSLVYANIPDIIQEYQEKDSLYDNKRELTKKYMGADFYYIVSSPEYSILPVEEPGTLASAFKVTSIKKVPPIRVTRTTTRTTRTTRNPTTRTSTTRTTRTTRTSTTRTTRTSTTRNPTTRNPTTPPGGSSTSTSTTRTTTTRTTTTRTTTTRNPTTGNGSRTRTRTSTVTTRTATTRNPTTRTTTSKYGWNCISPGTACVFVRNGRYVNASECENSCKQTTRTTREPLTTGTQTRTTRGPLTKWSCVTPAVEDGCKKIQGGRYDDQASCDKFCTTRTTTTRTSTTRTSTTRTTREPPTTQPGPGPGGGGGGGGGSELDVEDDKKKKKYKYKWCCRATKDDAGKCSPACVKFVPGLLRRVELEETGAESIKKPGDCTVGDFETENACKNDCEVIYGCTSRFPNVRTVTGCFAVTNNAGNEIGENIPLGAVSFTSKAAAQQYCNWGTWDCDGSESEFSGVFTDVFNSPRTYFSYAYGSCKRKGNPAGGENITSARGRSLPQCLTDCASEKLKDVSDAGNDGTCNPCNLLVSVQVKPTGVSSNIMKYAAKLEILARDGGETYGTLECKNGTGNPATLVYKSISNPNSGFQPAGAINYDLSFEANQETFNSDGMPAYGSATYKGHLIGTGTLDTSLTRDSRDRVVPLLLPSYLNVNWTYSYDRGDQKITEAHIGPKSGVCKVAVPSFPTLVPGQEQPDGGAGPDLNSTIKNSLDS